MVSAVSNRAAVSCAKVLCAPSSAPMVCISCAICSSHWAQGLLASMLSFQRNQSASLNGARSSWLPSASSVESTPLSSSVRQSGVPTAASLRPVAGHLPISTAALWSCAQPGSVSHAAAIPARIAAGAAYRISPASSARNRASRSCAVAGRVSSIGLTSLALWFPLRSSTARMTRAY